MNYSNEELIALAKKGDSLAKEKLFEINLGFCHTIAQRYKTSDIEYDDILAVSFLGMLKAYNTFDESKGYKFITYAGLCMTNAILNEIRKYKKQPSYMYVSIEEEIFNNGDADPITYKDMLPDTKPLPYEIVELKDLLEHMRKAIKVLKGKKKEVIELYYFQGHTMKEVASILDTSQPYVSLLISQALTELRKIIE